MLPGFAALGSICLALTLAETPATTLAPRVRGVNPAAAALIASGASRSPTFARLLRELEATDLVVYLEVSAVLPPGLDGRLTFMTTAGGVRYLRAQIASGSSADAAIACAGHELQHALEIAAHPAVRSSGQLRTLYQRIGVQTGVKDRYDTMEARVIGRRVRAELG